MKKFIHLLIPIFIISCSNPEKVWENEAQNFTTIEEFIDEFGEPKRIEDNTDYLEKYNEEVMLFEDMFNPGGEEHQIPGTLVKPKRSVDEIVDLLKEWNKLAEENYDRLTGLGLTTFIAHKGTAIERKINGAVDYNHWSSTQPDSYNSAGRFPTKEYNFRIKNFPISTYKEKISDRKKRLIQINEKLDEPLFWEDYVYRTDVGTLNTRGYIIPNKSKTPGLVLNLKEPKKPEYSKIYTFYLYDGTWGEHSNNNDLPDDTVLKYFGPVNINWDNSIKFFKDMTFYTYSSYTLCECFNDPDLVDNKICNGMFMERYGITKTNALGSNTFNGIMKRDYDDCN